MSLSSDGNQGYLDIRNAILRVGTLDVYGITGVDQVTNVVKQNSVLIWDDQGSDMTTPPFQKGAGVLRSTSPPEINLVDSAGNNFMYQGLKLPNSWQGEFDLYFADATEGAINCHFYTTSTTSYVDDGYELAFDRENSTVTLRYDATQVAQATGVSLSSTQWHTASVTFNRGAWAVALDAERVLTHDDDERSAVYDNTTGQYVRFETTATTDRKVRYIKFLNNGAPWLESNAGHLYNLSGNVAIGVSEDDYRFSVAGTANVGALTTTSVNVTGGVDATSVSTGDLTLTGLGVESNIYTSNLYASSNVGIGTTKPVQSLHVNGTALISDYYNGELQVRGRGLNYSSWIDITATQRSQSLGQTEGWWRIQSYGTTGQNGLFSIQKRSIDGTSLVSEPFNINKYSNVGIGTTNPLYKLDVHGTANVGAVTLNSNVYAPNLPLAEVASNLVTWDSTTGDLMDSGGLISNKFAVVSEQPPAALTGDSTVVDGHGRYKVTTSLQAPSYQGWKVFDKTIGAGTTGWSTGAVSAYNVDGTYAGSNVIAGVSGEWVKIEFPYKTTLRHVSLSPNVYYSAMPENFSIVASNDDSNWTVIKSVTGQAWTSADYVNFVVNAGVAYKYYAIVAQLTNTNYAYIGEWRLFTETFTVDAGVVSTTAASGLDVGYTEHPVEPITDFRTYVEGHGTYEASVSSYSPGLYPWEAFDYNIATRWSVEGFGPNKYNATTGLWDQTSITAYPNIYTDDVGGTRYAGHWLQIKLPYAITLSHSNVHPTNTLEYRAPKDGVILGSNDGQNWYKLTQFTGKTYTASTWTRIDVNATTPYQYFRLCTTKIGTGASQFGYLELTEWRLFAEKSVTRMENVHIGDLSSETLQTGYIKWPKVPLKANESEGYVATRSSRAYANYEAWKAFNENANPSDDAWIGGLTNYTTGGYPITTSGAPEMNGVYGDWLGIELPQSIKVSYIQLLNRNYSESGRLPTSGRFYGSKDNITFTELTAWSNISISPGYEPTRIDVNSNDTYKTYRIQVERLYYGGTGSCAIGELQLFEAATGVGAAPTSAKLQVAGSLGMAKGAEFFAGDDVVMELPKTARLMSFPKDALTGYTTPSGYVVSQPSDTMWDSSVPTNNRNAWALFDKTFVEKTGEAAPHFTVSGSSDRNYNSSGEYTGSNSLGGISGDWVSIKLPHKIQVQSVNYWRRYATTRQVLDATVLGSTDGTNWTSVGSWRNADFSSIVTNFPMNTSKYYDHLACVFERINGTDGYVNFHELEFLGYQEYDDEATGVDVVHRSIPNKPGQQHLEVYWDANDSNSYSFADSSNVYDLSGNGVTGTITGNNGFDAEYNAWVFDGSGDYIRTSNAGNGTGEWVHSMSAWFKVINPGSGINSILHLGTWSQYDESRIFIDDGKLRATIYGATIETNESIPENTWMHGTLVYTGGYFDTSNALIYVNGDLMATAQTQTAALPTLTGTTFTVGATSGNSEYFNGQISNARLYSKALNADQIRELYEYDAPRFGHRQNLVSLHKGNLGVGVAHPTSRFEVAGADGVQEYPPKAMTGFETYMEGHGVFKVHKSGDNTYIGVWPAWEAFNEVFTDAYHGGNFYTGTDYAYAGTETLGGISGDYVILELPYKIKAKQISLAPYPTIDRTPEDFTILGSNDNVNWTKLATFNGITNWTSGVYKSFNINSDEYFNHFAVVVTRLVADQYFMISEIKYYGTPAPSAIEDGHLTLGKALTLPRVSGHAAGAETPRAESLVVHYDTTVDSVVSGSTVVDISGEGANGTLNGNATYSSTDRALTFDGTGDYVSGTIPTTTGAWVHSVSLWTKVNESDTFGALFLIGSLSEDNCSASRWNGANVNQLFHFFYDNDFLYEVQKTPNTWMHLLFTYDGGSAVSSRKLYVNGVQARVISSSTGTPLNLVTTSTPLYFGAMPANPYDGSISNIKIWDVALTAEEVAAEYALGRTGKSINLTDTSLCLGGTVPRAQLDVRGAARFETMNVDGNVGIGTASPKALAHVGKLSANSGTFNDIPQSNMGISATFPDSTRLWLSNRLEATGEDYWGMALGTKYTGDMYIQSVNKASNAIYDLLLQPNGGKVGIGTTNPGGKLHVSGDLNLGSSSNYLFRPSVYWYQTYGGTSGYTRAYMEVNNTWTLNVNGNDKMYIRPDAGVVLNDFTGQHRCFVDGVHSGNIDDYVGLIVCANKNAFTSASFNVYKGNRAIQMDETLPDVSLSKVARDKSCFGVISHIEDEEKREDTYGSITIPVPKEVGDTRVYINSVGEGAMWVVNTNGPLESGDYITTSNVAGYGQRQDDDILHNYTVAKITMDCDFNPPDIPVQRILKELANVTYWYQLEDATSNAYDRTQEETYYTKDRHVEVHGHVDEQSNVFVPPDHDLELYSKTQVNTVSEEVYNALPEDEQALYDSNTFTYTQVIEISPEVWSDLGVEEQNTYVHGYFNIVTDEVPSETPGAVERTRTVYKNVVNETKVEPVRPEDYLSEVREEWVNVLDENDQIQWEDVPWGDTEPAYKLRYLDAEGQITTRHNAVHTAAFVGVTYHCG
jgi:hypothetical protein